MTDPHERDLQEVERALSVLGGRHPEQVRAKRLAAEAAAKRLAEHQADAAAERRAAWKKRAIAIGGLGVIFVAGVFAWRFVAARRRADAEIAPLVARYVALGFDALPRGALAAQDRVELTTVAGDCYAFVASAEAQMRIERPVGTAGALGEALVCTCASENVVVTTPSAPDAIVRALHVAGGSLGGTRAAMFRFPERAPTVIAGDEACADEMLAKFAREARYPKQDAAGAWLASHPALVTAGFTTVASASARRLFAFAPPGAPRCFLAATDGGDALTLWSLDATFQKPIEHAKTSLAWCSVKDPPTFVVERAAPQSPTPGTITIASAPSAAIGGMLGLREIARAADVAITTWTRDEERGALAIDALRASVVPDPVATGCETIDAPRAKDARVFLFSSAGPETFQASELDYRCAPSLGEPESLCVEARALVWRAPPPNGDKSAVCAAAYGPLPYWMSAIADVHDAAALDAELALVGFARRLAARGFAPSVIEGVTEKRDAVEILGRSGDDAVVAVGLWPAPPFVHPYPADVAWTIDSGEPHVIPMTGGERVSLAVHAPQFAANVSPDKRRTVVFRHSAAVIH